MAWFAHHAEHQMHTSSITQAEVLSGIAMLPQGKRRDRLAHAAYQVFEREFAQHCLPFDQGAARHYAHVRAERKQQGLPITTEDAQIAAIALSNNLVVATRNTKDFRSIPGLSTADPWQNIKPDILK